MVHLTDAAASKLQGIMTEKGLVDYALRVFVQGGGCGGMQYGMTFDNRQRDGDQVFGAPNGLKVYVDPTSLTYISGAQIDYLDSLMGGGFHIENPQAVSTCGCGSSFRTEKSETDAETAGTACHH
jgi:iron-sulfur cluster assembly accessory protein